MSTGNSHFRDAPAVAFRPTNGLTHRQLFIPPWHSGNLSPISGLYISTLRDWRTERSSAIGPSKDDS